MKRAYLGGVRSREDDRISELPDEIIHDILERLQSPMEVAKSTLLSRRWIHIWRSYPILEFHGPHDYSYSEKLLLFVAAAAKKLSSSDEHNHIKAVRISSSSTSRSLCDFAILTDCLMLASILTGGSNSWPWDRATLIEKLQSALVINLDISISFVTPRRHNVRADWVARSFAHGSLPQDWIQIADAIPER
ncbi:hypothetical protein LINPERHAP1_LOCUS5407 [Linum perenne]